MKQQIIENYEKFGSSYIRKITNRKTHLYDYIWDYLDQLYPILIEHSKSEKLFWFIYDLDDFPKCKNCNNDLNQPGQFLNFKSGYRQFCCKKCSKIILNNNIDIKNKMMQTKLKRYGNVHWNNNAKIKQTKLDRYGDSNYNNPEKTKQTCLNKYGCVTPLHNKEIKEKIKESNIQKYGNSVIFKTDYFKKKRILTCNEHYGVDYPMQAPENIKKRMKTSLEKYGEEFPLRNKDIKNKQKLTNLKKYGYISTMQSKVVQEKARITNNKKYGCDWPAQSREIAIKQRKHYFYKNIYFDSKPEIALYIWLIDHNINFEYQPNNFFEYEYDGKLYKYFPDFKIDDKFYEIKGNHMISKTGDWVCPWDHSKDAKYKNKGKCAITNGVIILIKKDYQQYLDYINIKYGKKWLDQFKINQKTLIDTL